MAGDIDHDCGVGRRRLHPVEEVADDAAQIALVEVAPLDDLEAGAGEGLPDKGRIVDRGRQLSGRIGALADHEREARLGPDGSCGERGEQEEGGREDMSENHDLDPCALGPAHLSRCGRD